jgi:GT2 family glycosyltransferase
VERLAVTEGEFSVVIPTQDHQTVIEGCLRSLYSQSPPPEEVILIDRGSKDETLLIVEEGVPSVHIIKTRRRVRLAQALNRAFHETHYPWVAFLFPEVKLGKGYFKSLHAALNGDHHVESGFATGKIFKMFRGKDILDSTGLEFQGGRPFPVKRGEGKPGVGQYDEAERVAGAPRAAVLYRRTLLEDVTLFGEVFDESLVEVLEDIDLAWRAHLLGWKGIYVPEASAIYDVRDERPGPGFANALHWEFSRRVVMLKNAPTPALLSQGHRFLCADPQSQLSLPGAVLSTLFALAGVSASLTSIRCKRQEIQRRAAERSAVQERPTPESTSPGSTE